MFLLMVQADRMEMVKSLKAAIRLCAMAALGRRCGFRQDPDIVKSSNCFQKYDGGLHCRRLMKKYTMMKMYTTARQEYNTLASSFDGLNRRIRTAMEVLTSALSGP